ncbi:hypothetical protein CPC08DRAFT_766795 [Agrocybe pediades]|nr:hypothetical protein CPC08DRAFT_766795 [Agrocybe pediades]
MLHTIYDHHSGYYRSVDPDSDLSKPWQNTPFSQAEPCLSPLRPVFNIPIATGEKPLDLGSSPSSSSSATVVSPVITVYRVQDLPPPSLLKRILRFLKLSKESVKAVREEVPILYDKDPTPYDPLKDKVKLHEWKEYGYWARPFVNNVVVQNIPEDGQPPIPISTPELRERIASLRHPVTDATFPQNWVPGVIHRALPPKPTRWKDPVPGEPLPFPWEVQINPILQHHLWGPAPMQWWIFDRPIYASQGRTAEGIVFNYADFAQPATYPFLTHMHFNAVAGDTAPRYPWPFTVVNLKGITVIDVLVTIYEEFQVEVDIDERRSWSRLKQMAADRTLKLRMELGSTEEVPYTDVMRRCDALGCIMSFRGIEPTVDGGGWMISFGTH